MTTTEIFILIILGVACIIGITIEFVRGFQAHRARNRFPEPTLQVLAMVTRVHVESDIWKEKWYITANWIDVSTGKTYVFRRGPLPTQPKEQVGEPVLVLFDPSQPQYYEMQLG